MPRPPRHSVAAVLTLLLPILYYWATLSGPLASSSAYVLDVALELEPPSSPSPAASISSANLQPLPSASPFPSSSIPQLSEEDEALLEIKKKVKVLVTTVAQNRGRVELLRRVYKDDPWARDLFIFVSDAEDLELGTVTVPECNAVGSWVAAKCCRFTHFYFTEWEEQYPEVEWVFKADDDTYVHPRNLLLTVASLLPPGNATGDAKPLFLGDRTSWGHGRRDDDPAYTDLSSVTIWPNGGAGWLINRAARDHLKGEPRMGCGGLDDVGFGDWVTRGGLPLTPYFGFHQRSTFEGKPYEQGQDFLGTIKPAAFFLCVKDDVIRLPYYPVTFHKLMATFPQMHEIMQKKRFELLPLPPLRPEDRALESRSDNYYRRVRPWLDAQAVNASTQHVDCHALFDLAAIWELKRDLRLP